MEAPWSSRVSDVRSVTPVLQALQDAGVARHTRQAINSRDDLVKQLKRLAQKQHEDYTIGYVAMHGSPGRVYAGRKSIELVGLEAELPQGALAKKVLHFGSCSVLTDEVQQGELLRALGAKVITGFTEDVDWFESLAFELILFEALAWYARPSDAEKYIAKNHGQLAGRLGFVMIR
ncbi:DUF6642 family protein [Janibacter limosus]|uniref:DUF6642 family protein n=1 Tax=Janibacter limosus TaxID=53458 RepID=UPI003F6FFD4B